VTRDHPAPGPPHPPGLAPSEVSGADESEADLRAVLVEAAAWYRDRLLSQRPSRVLRLLGDRGLADLSVDTPAGVRWQLGYTPTGRNDRLVSDLRTRGYPDGVLVAAGLAVGGLDGGLVDFFRNRLVVPLRDRGGVVGFTGRRLDDRREQIPKWLNTPTTALYRKGAHVIGLTEQADLIADGRGRVVLVEGPFDAIAVHLAGDVGLAAGGTALTAEQVAQLVAVTGLDRPLHVAYDPDGAGHTATVRAAHLLGGTPTVQVLLPAGQDPAELLAAHGGRALRRALSRTRPLAGAAVEDRLDGWAVHLRAGNVAAAVDAVREVAPLIHAAAAGEHADLVALTADRTGLDPAQVTAVLLDTLGPP
jgi:DNA primase